MHITPEEIHDAVGLLAPSAAIAPKAPLPPDIAAIHAAAEEKMVGISVLASISYTSLSGHVKDRDVLIRRVIQNKQTYYIDGLAMDIKAPRLINVAHITQIRDGVSGRVYDDPRLFLHTKLGVPLPPTYQQAPLSQAPKDEFAEAIARIGSELTVLMYLVAIDGRRDKAERQLVFEYAKERTRDLSYPDEALTEYLISLAPDEESFERALHKTLTKEKSVIQSFVGMLFKIVMADQLVDEKERIFLSKIMDILEKEGYEFSLPL